MITPREAEQLIREHIPSFGTESCSLSDAHGRVLRGDLKADRDLPPFDRVTLDGYAVRAASLAAGTRVFRVGGLQAAGMRPFRLGPDVDACVEIMTGAALPEGADCIVPYEETKREGEFMTVAPGQAFAPGHAIHRRGSDQKSGDLIVRAPSVITSREIAVAAAVGATQLTVSTLPKIAVIATGDELVEVDAAAVAPYQIRRSNDHALRAALITAGWPRVERFHLRDVRHEVEHLLWHILAEFDVVLVTGGVSKGKFDFLPAELERQNVRKIFQGVAQRPGKPFWFGVNPRGLPVFALPGNPVSAQVCLHRYVFPALAQASGLPARPPTPVRLAKPFAFRPALACFLPVKMSSGGGAELRATPDPSNTSGDFAGLVGTDGFVELPPGPAEFPEGTQVPFWAWK